MSVKLVKKTETVYVARCQWAVAQDAEGEDIIPFGLLWERESEAEAADIVDRNALKTYGEGRFYHTWLEQVTRYDDGSEESTVVREYNRPGQAPEPQSGYAPCACRDCMDTTVFRNTNNPELCELCDSAGCIEWEQGSPAVLAWECQRDDAYPDRVGDAGTGHGASEYHSGA